jgi:4-hydroxy 2-oxovalerate aldolase
MNYQDIKCDDTEAVEILQKEFCNKEILLIGPGKNIIRQRTRVKDFILKNNPVIVAVNYVPKDIKVDAIFLTNAKRYTQLLTDINGSINESADIIATSNVTKTAGTFKYVLRYGSLIDEKTDVIDNSLVMLLKAMIKIKVEKVYLAGFDGYSKTCDNYFDVSREYSYVKEKANYLNDYMKKFLSTVENTMDVEFITRSYYKK